MTKRAIVLRGLVVGISGLILAGLGCTRRASDGGAGGGAAGGGTSGAGSAVQVIASSDAPANSLFAYSGVTFSQDNIPTELRQGLYDIELDHFKKKSDFIDRAIWTLYIEELAKEKQKTPQDLETELLAVTDPSDAAIKKFYDENQKMIPYPFDKVKDQVKDWLRRKDAQAKRDELLAKVKADKKVTTFLVEPSVPRVDLRIDDFPSKGQGTKVTLVEFADYQCPHCAQAKTVLDPVLKEYEDKIKFVYVDFPINRSGISEAVALGAFCAREQDKYWQYHDLAFAEQKSLTLESPRKLAEHPSVAIKLDAFDQCMASTRPKEYLAKAKGEAKRVGVDSTPTVFLNNARTQAVHDAAELRRALDAALAGG